MAGIINNPDINTEYEDYLWNLGYMGKFDATLTGGGSGFIVSKINLNPEKEQLIKYMFNLFNGKVNNLQEEDISLYMMLTNKDKESTLTDINKFQSYVIKAREENKLYGRESWKHRY